MKLHTARALSSRRRIGSGRSKRMRTPARRAWRNIAATAWAFISGTICPEWSSEHHRLSFFIGYEDRATELADEGEAGYEALAEAGTVADTAGWVLQSEPWRVKASRSEKALRAVRAAWVGAAAWLAKAASNAPRTGFEPTQRRFAQRWRETVDSVAGTCSCARPRPFIDWPAGIPVCRRRVPPLSGLHRIWSGVVAGSPFHVTLQTCDHQFRCSHGHKTQSRFEARKSDRMRGINFDGL
jgi:hypothetical protein